MPASSYLSACTTVPVTMTDHAYIPTGNMARYHWFISWMIPPVPTTFNCIFIRNFLCCWRVQHVQWVSLCLLRELVLKDNYHVFPSMRIKSACTCSSLHLPALPLVFELTPPTEAHPCQLRFCTLRYFCHVCPIPWDFHWDIMCTLSHLEICSSVHKFVSRIFTIHPFITEWNCFQFLQVSVGMIEFWKNLPDAVVEDEFLTLSSGSCFLGAVWNQWRINESRSSSRDEMIKI